MTRFMMSVAASVASSIAIATTLVVVLVMVVAGFAEATETGAARPRGAEASAACVDAAGCTSAEDA